MFRLIFFKNEIKNLLSETLHTIHKTNIVMITLITKQRQKSELNLMCDTVFSSCFDRLCKMSHKNRIACNPYDKLLKMIIISSIFNIFIILLFISYFWNEN